MAAARLGVCVLGIKGPHGLAIDAPLDRVGLPDQGISVSGALRVVDVDGGAAVVGARDALAKVVCLHPALARPVAKVVSRPLPVHLVQRVRHEHDGRHHALALGHLHLHVDPPVPHVPGADELRRVEPLEVLQRDATAVARDLGPCGRRPVL